MYKIIFFGILLYEEGDKSKNYYHEYCKLFVANIVLS